MHGLFLRRLNSCLYNGYILQNILMCCRPSGTTFRYRREVLDLSYNTLKSLLDLQYWVAVYKLALQVKAHIYRKTEDISRIRVVRPIISYK